MNTNKPREGTIGGEPIAIVHEDDYTAVFAEFRGYMAREDARQWLQENGIAERREYFHSIGVYDE